MNVTCSVNLEMILTAKHNIIEFRIVNIYTVISYYMHCDATL